MTLCSFKGENIFNKENIHVARTRKSYWRLEGQ